jgi:hypothetical protein
VKTKSYIIRGNRNYILYLKWMYLLYLQFLNLEINLQQEDFYLKESQDLNNKKTKIIIIIFPYSRSSVKETRKFGELLKKGESLEAS